ncbi:MAG: hypothetical protein ABIB61_01535 [Candidatus Shapirobacteria bacterium]
MPRWSQAVLTNKALEKMKKHGLSRGDIQGVFEKYQKKEDTLISGCTSFIRTLGSKEIGAIARQKENSFWLIISVWKRKLFRR